MPRASANGIELEYETFGDPGAQPLARSVDQATSLIPLLLIPQLLFGAALVPFARMSAPIKALADLMPSRWALESRPLRDEPSPFL